MGQNVFELNKLLFIIYLEIFKIWALCLVIGLHKSAIIYFANKIYYSFLVSLDIASDDARAECDVVFAEELLLPKVMSSSFGLGT